MKTWHTILGATALSVLGALAIVRGPQWFGPASGAPHGDHQGHPQGKPQGQATQPAGTPPPWQVTPGPDGSSEALGLTLGTSTLADVRQRFGIDTQIAIIAAPGEDGALEAFVDRAQAGFIAGKLVVTAALPASSPATVRSLRERALKSEFMESTTRKYTLRPEDEALALQARIVALSFIPQASLDADIILARFGTPAARVRSNGRQEHFLYPDKGLDVILDTEGKELLQYVAPRDFERLRAPLQAASAASATSAASAPQAAR
ncbi:MAG: hypothetical protein AABZ19_04135 [Pseudomonadota bacterium]